MALLAALASFTHLVGGLTNAGLCQLMRALLDPAYNARKATFDLRRLRRKGFIERVRGTSTYRVTPHGRQIACLFTKLAAHVVVPTLTELEATPTTRPRPPTGHHRLAHLRARGGSAHPQLRARALKLDRSWSKKPAEAG
jgi:hypothetical protein